MILPPDHQWKVFALRRIRIETETVAQAAKLVAVHLDFNFDFIYHLQHSTQPGTADYHMASR